MKMPQVQFLLVISPIQGYVREDDSAGSTCERASRRSSPVRLLPDQGRVLCSGAISIKRRAFIEGTRYPWIQRGNQSGGVAFGTLRGGTAWASSRCSSNDSQAFSESSKKCCELFLVNLRFRHGGTQLAPPAIAT